MVGSGIKYINFLKKKMFEFELLFSSGHEVSQSRVGQSAPGGLLAPAVPVCALLASRLQDLVQLLHHHGRVDLRPLGKHLGLLLQDTQKAVI